MTRTLRRASLRFSRTFALSAVLALPLPAFADNGIVVVSLPLQALPDQPLTIAGQATDIVGVSLGLSPDAIKDAFTKQGYLIANEVKTNRSTSAQINNIYRRFDSEPFLDYLEFRKEDPVSRETVQVWFTLPVQGQKAYRIVRLINYPDAAHQPTAQSIDDSARSKYGPWNHASGACWTFAKGRRVDTNLCLDADSRTYAERDIDLAIRVSADLSGANRANIQSIRAYVTDTRAPAAMDALWDKLSQAAIAGRKAAETLPPTAAPKL